MFGFISTPFAALLKMLNDFLLNYGVAVILFALATKIVLLYFSARGKRSMMQQQRLMPRQQELQKKYEKDKVKYQQELQKLYQDEGVSMMGGCLWSLLPLIILIPLYTVIRTPMVNIMNIPAGQYPAIVDIVSEVKPNLIFDLSGKPFSEKPEDLVEAARILKETDAWGELKLSKALSDESNTDVFESIRAREEFSRFERVNYDFLGLDLSEIPGLNIHIVIPILSGGTAFLAMWLSMRMTKKAGIQQRQGKFMMLLSPGLSLYFAFIMPALMGVYWITQNVFGMVQDYFLTKHYQKVFAAEDAKRAELEARRRAAEEAMKEELRQRRAEAIAAKKQKRKPGQTVYKIHKKPKPNDEAEE